MPAPHPIPTHHSFQNCSIPVNFLSGHPLPLRGEPCEGTDWVCLLLCPSVYHSAWHLKNVCWTIQQPWTPCCSLSPVLRLQSKEPLLRKYLVLPVGRWGQWLSSFPRFLDPEASRRGWFMRPASLCHHSILAVKKWKRKCQSLSCVGLFVTL